MEGMSSRLDIALYALKTILNMDLSVVRVKARSTALNALDQIEGMPSDEEDVLQKLVFDTKRQLEEACEERDRIKHSILAQERVDLEEKFAALKKDYDAILEWDSPTRRKAYRQGFEDGLDRAGHILKDARNYDGEAAITEAVSKMQASGELTDSQVGAPSAPSPLPNATKPPKEVWLRRVPDGWDWVGKGMCLDEDRVGPYCLSSTEKNP